MVAESPLTVAQRAAIARVRACYECGDLTVAALASALDAITEAASVESVIAVVSGLPTAQHSALAAFDTAPSARPVRQSRRIYSRISAAMGSWRRNQPWMLAAQSTISSVMGDVLVDLRQAHLPPHGHISITVTMGKARLLIPRGVRISARSFVIMGAATTLDEKIGGLFASDEVEHDDDGTAPIAELEIDAWVVMGELELLLVDV